MPILGWRSPRSAPVPPRVTPCSIDTFRHFYPHLPLHRGCFGNLAAVLEPYGVVGLAGAIRLGRCDSGGTASDYQ